MPYLVPEIGPRVERIFAGEGVENQRERCTAEILRLETQIGLLEAKLQSAEEHGDELEALMRINPDTSLPVFRILYQDVEKKIAQGEAFWLVQVRLDNAYQRIRSTRDKTKVLLYITTLRIKKLVGEVLYQSDRIDEFFLIMPLTQGGPEEFLHSLVVLERAIELPHEGPAGDVSFGTYMGVCPFPGGGMTTAELFTNVEISLHHGMSRKKRISNYSNEIGSTYHRQNRLEQDLHGAIQTGFEGFYMVYQPFVDPLHTIRGCESLIRWNHPEFGFIPPPDFIPIAERNGDIRMFGRWILYKSVQTLKAWHDAGFTNIFVSVNLSPIQFNQRDLVEKIADVLRTIAVDPRFLKLEITEGAVMAEPADAVRKLNALRSLGIRISIDDFGTGYSSLNYLRKLPIDTLKIDKSFVDDLVGSQQNQEIVRAILAMSKSLGIETLAEGVEDGAQRDFLFAEGCDYIQGYYYSKPVTEDLFLGYLEQGGKLPLDGGMAL